MTLPDNLLLNMALKLYYDSLSQPCRAVEIFLKVNNISYVPEYISISSGEQRTNTFSKINQLKKLPAIAHNGKCLSESIAIMRYLSREYKIDDHWYPKDSFKQAKIDEYLEWHHLGLRFPCYNYVWLKALYPLVGKKQSQEFAIKSKKYLVQACDIVNNVWLKENPFLGGLEISIADLLAATELEQLVMTDFNPKDGRPALTQWINKVRFQTNPHYDNLQKYVLDFKKDFIDGLNSHL